MDYTEEQINLIVKNVSNSDEGLKFIEILLDKLGAFERGFNFQNRDVEIANKSRREQGLWLLDLLQDSNFNKFIEIQKIRSKKVWKMNKQQD